MTVPPIHQTDKIAKVFLILMILGSLASCNRGTQFESERKFESESWHKDSLVEFHPVIEDTSQVFNVGFSLEHSNEYPYSNLWLFVDVESPGGHVQTDTMEYFLADPEGDWIGKGSDRSMKLYWLFKGGVKLADPGEYKFTLQQGMRRDRIDGIKAVSLWIEKAETEE